MVTERSRVLVGESDEVDTVGAVQPLDLSASLAGSRCRHLTQKTC